MSSLDAASAVERQSTSLPQLSPRELEVLCCVAEGLTNSQIADRLFVSDHTIHRHISSILRELDLPNRTAAAHASAPACSALTPDSQTWLFGTGPENGHSGR